ncbi:VIT1/CCC1 transporter family protein [Streptococcus caprae]|uniref:VIT family protein n=1 Tax=Streptococcus caprae TaxID=1640501 RepID=A0ABV8CT45_9STRE
MTSQFSERLNILRAGVLGANDGIVSVAGVVIGVASATNDTWVIFLSGISAILAGAFSMAGGEYVSVSTQKDTEIAATERERRLYETDPKVAKQSLYDHYLAKGECSTAAEVMTNRAFAKNPVKFLVEEKYNLEYESFTNPWKAAISSFLAFSIGALFPMLAVMVAPENLRIPLTMFLVVVSLFLTGYSSAKLGNAPTWPAIRRNIGMGLLTMLATFVIGHVLGAGYIGG